MTMMSSLKKEGCCDGEREECDKNDILYEIAEKAAYTEHFYLGPRPLFQRRFSPNFPCILYNSEQKSASLATQRKLDEKKSVN